MIAQSRLSRSFLRFGSSLAAVAVALSLALGGASAAHADGTVNPLSAAPVAATTRQGQAITIQLLGSGPVGDQLYYYSGAPSAAAPQHGTLSRDPNGGLTASTIVYTPTMGYSGIDTFQYVVGDSTFNSTPGTVTVVVTPVPSTNHAPIATAASYSVEDYSSVDIQPAGTDIDGDVLSFSPVTQPTHGTLTVSPGPIFSYAPTGDYVGPDSFTFVANDGVLSSAPVTISLSDIPQRANSIPTSVPPTLTTAQDTPVSTTLTAFDADGDQIFFELYGDAGHGTVTGGSDGKLTYTPTLGFSGQDSFHYDVTDHRGTSDTYTVNVTVTPANPLAHTPTVSPLSVVSHSSPVSITLLGTDPDGKALSYTTAGGPSHGALSGSGANLVYTPDASFSGSDAFTYTASNGTYVSSPASVQISIVPVTAPINPSLDVSVSADRKPFAGGIASPKFSTTGPDRLVLAFITADGPGSWRPSTVQGVTSVTGGGLSWSLVTRSRSGWGTAEVWQAHATSPLSGASVTARFARAGFEGSITVAAFANTAGSVGSAIAASGYRSAPATNITVGSATSLVWATGHVWTRGASPVPLGGQDLVHSFVDRRAVDSFWTERLSLPYGSGAVTIGVSSPIADRWQLAAVTIPAAAVPPLTR